MKRAFTLIELLVVIAIIAILAAILFPVFAQAKVAAKKTSSLSNIKQLNLGVVQYAAVADDIHPVPYSWVGWNFDSQLTWDVAIQPYTGTRVLQTLPNGTTVAARDGGLFTASADSTGRVDGRSKRSYAWNGSQIWAGSVGESWGGYKGFGAVGDMNLDGDTVNQLFPRPLSATAFDDPAGTLLLVEKPTADNLLASTKGSFAENPGEGVFWQHRTGQAKGDHQNRPVAPLYAGTWNYAFVDGHAKNLRPERTLGPAALGDMNSPLCFGMWSREAND